MFSLKFIKNENHLNKLLKSQKKNKQDMAILFISLWDEYSDNLVEKLKSKYLSSESVGTPIYVVDSFLMPHAFVIFNTTKVPHLVRFKRGNIESNDYLPNIYKELGL